jgi:heme iron utilization protein
MRPNETAPGLDAVARAGSVRELLAAKPDGVVEQVAREAGVPVVEVLCELPEEQRVFAPPAAFAEVWDALTTWGDVLLIVHTPDIVLECKGALPPGSHGSGYWNFHGDSPIGGHLKAANCAHICFVDRPFHGRRSCSVQFFNGDGDAMFKVFVIRGPDKQLDQAQLDRFETTRRLMAGTTHA